MPESPNFADLVWRGDRLALPLALVVACWVSMTSTAYAGPPSYFMPPHPVTRPSSATPGTGPDASARSSWPGSVSVLRYQNEAQAPVMPKPDWQPLDLSALSRIGPVVVERSQGSPLREEKGVTTIFAYPLKGVPGMDLTASFFGGQRNTVQGAPGGSAAITAGIRIHW
ncbi:hypothetical protein [Brytella acorum]|uniref:Uncharacterized protein n=1 Tax=Brytella acorum TaxID=2959299 RepID=A0AA35V7P2_9PROT|nr:hypothetical protein [Brytella acorum]MDF3625190.1 hypothetical protein [Brytella acorum]CAI9119398.1 hypothetical protein LMG32879_000213 [Brytella acorum]